uniref:Signal recognition particle subunit SRP72 n=1 Tax=Cacopsylla melanoneura TaxID=428564 RepID=A0A8D8W6P3_9HEMI
MMAATPSLNSLYLELYKFCQSSTFDKALKSANKILHSYPDEEKALQCKIVSLLQLNKFDDALQTFEKYSKISENLQFEKAYCHYRLSNIKKALEIIDESNDNSLRMKELKAQVLYRLENYEDCYKVYKEVIKNTHDEYEDERETNLAAVIANLAATQSKVDVPDLRESTYELVYNAACSLIGKGQYIEAEKKLRLAEKLWKEALEDDEDEILDEIHILKVQQAYCMQMQGREKDSQNIYTSILKEKPTDVGLVAVANNNMAVINRDQNLFDSKKRMKNTLLDELDHKLNSRQKKIILMNNCLLALYTNQNVLCNQYCDKLLAKYPDAAETVALIKAVSFSKDNKMAEAVKTLEEYSNKYPAKQLYIRLAAVQLYLNQGDIKSALSSLEGLSGENKFRPGIVSALVSLYLASQDRDRASKILEQTVDWYRKTKVNASDLTTLWRQAADFHLRGGESTVAAKSLEELLKVQPDDKKTMAQLVIAYAQFDAKKALALSRKLPQLDPVTDVDVLESSNWVMGAKVIKKVGAKPDPTSPGTPTPGTGDVQKQNKPRHKKKKGKLPANYDPNVEPDPERWLPRHERSGFRKKRDRRVRTEPVNTVGKGTQGAATGAQDQFDITKMPSQVKTQSPAAALGEGPRQSHKKGQGNKNKKNKRR